MRTEYWSLHSEVRRLSRRDKRRQINEKASETEILINKNDGQSQRIAYKSIIKEVSGSFNSVKRFQLKIRIVIYLLRIVTLETGGQNISKQL